MNKRPTSRSGARGEVVDGAILVNRHDGAVVSQLKLLPSGQRNVPALWLRLAQLFPQPVAVGDVQFLHLLKLRQERNRHGDIVPVTLKLGNEFALALDMSPAFGHMAFGLREVPFYRFTVHS
jgi:hypothetical protein